MLTKDLIKFRRDKSKIYPEYIKKEDFYDKVLVDLAREFVEFFVVGRIRSEIKKFVEDMGFKYFKYLRYCNCFNKILIDEAKFSKSSFVQERMEYILKAQDIRNSYCKDNKERNYEIVEKDHLVSEDINSIEGIDYDRYIDMVMGEKDKGKVDIYRDHPDYSRIEEIAYFKDKDLLGLYNTRVMEWFFKAWESIKIKTKIGKEEKKEILNIFMENKIKIIDLKEDIKEKEQKDRKNKRGSEEFVINKENNKVGIEKIIQCLFYVLEKDNEADIVAELGSKGIVGDKSVFRYFYMKVDYSIPFKYYNFKKIMEEVEIDKKVDISIDL